MTAYSKSHTQVRLAQTEHPKGLQRPGNQGLTGNGQKRRATD